MIKAILFDFDDTLCQTFEQVLKIENTVLHDMNRKPFTKEALKQTWGPPRQDAIVVRSPGINVKDFMNRYYALAQALHEKNEIDVVSESNLKVLEKIQEWDINVSVLTSRSANEVRHLALPSSQLTKSIDSIYDTDATKHRKPDPRVFDVVLKDLQVHPSEILYVGDALDDAIASIKAGIHFVATLESGLRTKADFNGLRVDAFINNLTELIPLIVMWNKTSKKTLG